VSENFTPTYFSYQETIIMNKALVEQILQAAVMAPSGDNVQPWDLQVSENFTVINLYNLPEKDHSIYNYQQAASYIAHGALIENILISAKHLGCHADYQLFPQADNDNHIATISLSPAEPQSDPYYEAIFKRRTNRFPYQKKAISDQSLQALKESVKNLDTCHISLVNQQDKIDQLAKELKVNDRIVFECKEIHQFLFDKIRWNQQQIEETQDGMPVDVLGLNRFEKLAFPLLRFWGYVKIANLLGLSRIIELKCWWNCKQASLLGMISVQGNDKRAFIEGGRAVQRLWLEATVQGLALQPIIGLTLLMHRLKQGQLTELSAKHQFSVKRTSEMLPKLFAVDDDTLIMGFRLGYDVNEKQRVHTLRRALTSFF